MQPTSRLVRFGIPLFGAVVFLLIWEVAARLGAIKPVILPAPSAIARELADAPMWFAEQTFFTIGVALLGFAVAVVLGVAFAVAIVEWPLLDQLLFPLFVALNSVPKVAIAPLFIIWFGFGLAPKILLVFLLSFFPIVVAGVAGFKSVSPEILEFSRSTGVSWLGTFWKIRFPSAMPEIFTGLKVAAALASTAAVVAEFVAADRGLGYLLLVFNGEMLTPLVFADVLVLGVLGLVLYYAVEVAQRLIMPWHVSARHAQTSAGH